MGEHNVSINTIRTGVKILIDKRNFLFLFRIQEFLIISLDFGVIAVGAPGGGTIEVMLAHLSVCG
jgi:hypothetical protein